MSPARSPDEPSRPRRHRTRQRERLLELLCASRSHPTAAELYEAAHHEFPSLSLATVYRNLEVLISEGLAEAVPCEGGAMRYDGNPKPHHHFVCETCGSIQDVEIALPDELHLSLARGYDLRAGRTRVHFYGLCQTCSDVTIQPTE
jgi:Fe2+ or Zn2+ uptake regulation protein